MSITQDQDHDRRIGRLEGIAEQLRHAAIFRFGMLLALAALGASAATAQTDFFFATGTDSTGWAQAQSNADGHVLIESPQYPHGLWLHLVDEAGQPLANIQVEYQGQPDSLVAIHCVDPAGSVRETLIWSRPEGDSLRLTLKPEEASDELPAGIAAIDWQIDPIAEVLLVPEQETRLEGWEAMSAFLRERWQDQTGRVAVQLDASTSFAVELDHPEAVETLMTYLQQMYRPAGTSLGESAALDVIFMRGFALQEGIILYLPLFADSNLERVVREELGLLQGRLTLEDVAYLTRLKAAAKNIYSLAGLKHLTTLQTLDLHTNQITDVGPLAGLTTLQTLDLHNNQITDVGPLAGLTNLQSLSLYTNQITDVGPLAGLPNLQSLHLSNNQIADVTLLANLKNLQSLNLWDNQITDVTLLAGLTNLQSLSLSRNPIADVTLLANLKNLQSLHLSNNQIADVTPLAGLTNLQSLHLSNNQITDVTLLAGLTNLQSLSLWDNQIADVTPLANLKNLERLTLGSNQIADVTPLANLKNLQWLFLESNQIADVGPLANLKNLQDLRLNHNQITNVEPLAGLNNLIRLHLSYTQVVDLTPLANLTKVYGLRLNHNQITNVEPLAGLTNLFFLELHSNRIEDLAPLVANTGLDEGDRVNLENNPLSDQALNKQIPALRARGVDVRF